MSNNENMIREIKNLGNLCYDAYIYDQQMDNMIHNMKIMEHWKFNTEEKAKLLKRFKLKKAELKHK